MQEGCAVDQLRRATTLRGRGLPIPMPRSWESVHGQAFGEYMFVASAVPRA